MQYAIYILYNIVITYSLFDIIAIAWISPLSRLNDTYIIATIGNVKVQHRGDDLDLSDGL